MQEIDVPPELFESLSAIVRASSAGMVLRMRPARMLRTDDCYIEALWSPFPPRMTLSQEPDNKTSHEQLGSYVESSGDNPSPQGSTTQPETTSSFGSVSSVRISYEDDRGAGGDSLSVIVPRVVW